MVVHMVLRRPIPAPAPQIRVVWQGIRSGDQAEARWIDGSGQSHRWSGTRGVPWLQRDALREGEEWKVNLTGVPADVPAVSLFLTSSVGRTVGVMVQPLAGDPNAAVLHPGAALTPATAVEVMEFHRGDAGWQVVALNLAESADSRVAPQRGPIAPPAPPPSPHQPPAYEPLPADPGTTHHPAGSFAGWTGPVTDAPAPKHAADSAPGGRRPPGRPAPDASAGAGTRWADGSASADTLDQGPQVAIPDRLTGAVEAARSTGVVRRAPVHAVIDLSASMYPWIASGALADVLTATQAVAGAAHRPSLPTRFLPDGGGTEITLEADPAAALQEHLRVVGLRTGDRRQLVQALAGSIRAGGQDTMTLVVTDDPSLARQVGPNTTAVIVGADPGELSVVGEHVVAVGGRQVDVPRLARELAQRCFTSARR